MPTPDQQTLIDRIKDVFLADERIDAAALSGSIGRGVDDAWSDVDVVAAVHEDDLAACVAEYGGARNPLGETVFLLTLYGRIVTAVTPAWARYDLQFVTHQEYRGLDPTGLKPLFIRSGVAPPSGGGLRAAPTAPGRLLGQINEFLRVLGLLDVAVGREEWLVSQEGVGLLRKALIDMMVEANGRTGDRGGVKRLRAFLTDEQRQAVEALPPPAANRESLIAANIALARLYIPLARSVAEREGVAWPEAFEAATREHLARTLGMRF
jgi:hypothetical protein